MCICPTKSADLAPSRWMKAEINYGKLRICANCCLCHRTFPQETSQCMQKPQSCRVTSKNECFKHFQGRIIANCCYPCKSPDNLRIYEQCSKPKSQKAPQKLISSSGGKAICTRSCCFKGDAVESCVGFLWAQLKNMLHRVISELYHLVCV